jgi:hypothetical protein
MQSGKFLFLVIAITIVVGCVCIPSQVYPPVPLVPSVSRLEEFVVKNVRIRIEWTDYLNCEARVSYLTPEMKEFKEIEPVQVDQVQVSISKDTEERKSKLIRCGTLEGNQRCETCLFITEGSPTYMAIVIRGRTYYVCISGC